MPQSRPDPYVAFNYLVYFNGTLAGGFSEVSGLDAEIDTVDYRNGDEEIVARKLPGLTKFPHIVLKRGIVGSTDMFDWFRKTAQGSVERRAGTIVLRDELRKEVMKWTFRRGWVCKYTGPSLKGDSSAVAIESIEIVHEGLEVPDEQN